MPDINRIVIAGASLAGAKAAETLREEGYDASIVLIGDDHRRPYERPPLSKGLLLGTADEDSPYVFPADWYPQHDVDLRLSTEVTAIDRERRTVTAGGEELGYDRLLLATGSRPRRLPELTQANVLYLRSFDDSERLSEILRGGLKLTVLGSGWIGLEVAAAARQRGAEVTVISRDAVPLEHVLGERIGTTFADLHRGHGVTFHFGRRATGFEGADRVERVVLDDGTVVETDYLLVAIGAEPNVALAVQAGLTVDNGVLVDANHRTSDPAIFAAGDIASIAHPLFGQRIRVEHWANALQSGPAAARAMLDRGTPWDQVPYFFTDQYDLGMEYAGWLPPGVNTEIVVRGDLDKRECIVFWTVAGRVTAGMNVNVWDVTDDIQALIKAGLQGTAPDPAKLADPAVELAELLP